MDEKSHSLHYYKSENTSEKPQGSIDLLLIADVIPYDKNKDTDRTSTTNAVGPSAADLCRFNIDMGEGGKIFKFKCNNAADAENWIATLNAWREYCLMNMSGV